jgi:flagellar basal-body rod modification protein FlgD
LDFMATEGINKNPQAVLPPGTERTIAEKNAANNKVKQTKVEKDAIGQQEFLTLLITQLQNQDPLNPMDSQEFAVQLAQFSQVEQLISLNKKFDEGMQGAAGSVSTMAQFLGRQVALKDEPIQIAQGKGPSLMVDLPQGVQSLRVDFVDSENKVIGSQQVAEGLQAGKQVLSLDGVTVPDGEYEVRVMAVASTGSFQQLKARAVGIVEGFVLQPEPALIVGGQQVAMDKVEEVFSS